MTGKKTKKALSAKDSLIPVTKKTLQTGMVQGPAAIQALESALEPLAGGKNRYEAYREFLRMDPEANNAVTRLALLVQYAYKGVSLKPGVSMSEAEKTLLDTAQKEANAWNFRDRFYAIARHLIRDGDEIFVAEWDKGLKQIQPLPISKCTITEEKNQIGDVNAQIFGEEYYIVDEWTEDERQIFPENKKQKVYHVSVDNYGEEIKDLYGRYTFGVWSESPLECLRSRILWKQAILITDILWRYRNVPREVHELDTSHIRPELFEGASVEARLSTYQTAVSNYLKSYATEIQKKKVDQGYVITKGNRIYYVEPEKVSYIAANDAMEQINESIREGLGIKSGKGTYATELAASSYIILLPDMLAYKIKCVLLAILKQQMLEKHKTTAEDLDKLDLRISLVLDILRGELIRQIAVLAASGTHTRDQLRAKIGDDPLTQEELAEIIDTSNKGGRTGQFTQTPGDFLNTAERTEEPQEPITPQSRHDKQVT